MLLSLLLQSKPVIKSFFPTWKHQPINVVCNCVNVIRNISCSRYYRDRKKNSRCKRCPPPSPCPCPCPGPCPCPCPCGGCVQNSIFMPKSSKSWGTNRKVTIVGAGQVGVATMACLLTQGVTNEVCLIDLDEKKLEGEMLDFFHASVFLNNPRILVGKDYDIAKNSKICIITAGVRQQKGETRLDILNRNANVMKGIVPKLLKDSPDAIIIIASNPCDVLTYYVWKTSGLPKNKVIGSGTHLDSARFRYYIGNRLGVAPSSVNGYVIGEHGDSMVPVWSSVSVGGARLCDFNPMIGSKCDPENWHKIFAKVVGAGAHVRGLKGYTSWAVSMAIVDICRGILDNANTVHTVSTYIKGEHCINDETFLSLPCILGEKGVVDIVRQPLSNTELELLYRSAAIILKVQAGLKFDKVLYQVARGLRKLNYCCEVLRLVLRDRGIWPEHARWRGFQNELLKVTLSVWSRTAGRLEGG